MLSIRDFFIYLFIMAGVTYLIRALPLVIFKGKITNRFVQSFLYYVPYAVLGAMTFPSILFSTGNLAASIAGLITACVLAFKEKSLIIVAAFACLASFCVILIVSLSKCRGWRPRQPTGSCRTSLLNTSSILLSMVLICLRSEIGNGISDKKAFLLIKYTHTKRDFRLFGSSFFVHKNIPRHMTRDKKC